MEISRSVMDELVQGLPTKSAKIRILAKKGVKQADIARFLGIRDQFVSNVVRGPTPKSEQLRKSAPVLPDRLELQVGPGGRIVIPAAFREAMGVAEGDMLIARVDGGEMHLVTPKMGLRKAKQLVRKWTGEGESLADELIEERRREAKEKASG